MLTIVTLAIAATLAFWLVLLLTDTAVGLGLRRFEPPDGVMLGLFILHLVTAPVGWLTAVVVTFSHRRTTVAILGLTLVPLVTFISLGAAMTDAWAWNTAAARASGTASTILAAAAVAAGPIALLALLTVAIRTEILAATR